MPTISINQLDNIFEIIKSGISRNVDLNTLRLNNLRPSAHELNNVEWRYRLAGFAEGLCSTNILGRDTLNQLILTLFGEGENPADRPSRRHKFSVDIINKSGAVFSFNVPAVNPFDAYVQLTKRTAYKTIPDIETVSVYTALRSERQEDQTPVRVFNERDLIHVQVSY